MKRVIMAIVLIAASFTTKAQTIDPDFKTKCDNLLDAIQSKVAEWQQSESSVGFADLIPLIRTVCLDNYYASQFDDYLSVASTERTTHPVGCVGSAIIGFNNCAVGCCPAWIQQGNPNGNVNCYPQCTTCTTNFQNAILACYGLAWKPKPSPSR